MDFHTYAAQHNRKPDYINTAFDRANEEFSVREVLAMLGQDIPDGEFESYKILCPFTYEHKKPFEKNCRVYGYDNVMNCFALHGRMTPVDIYAYQYGLSSKEAAEKMLDLKGIRLNLTLEERWSRMTSGSQTAVMGDLGYVTEALRNRLRRSPTYVSLEYDDRVRKAWEKPLDALTRLETEAPTREILIKWVEASYQYIMKVVNELKANDGTRRTDT